MTEKPDWVPKHLSKTRFGQTVGLTPLRCESEGGSDSCAHCGASMTGVGSTKACVGLEELRLRLVPDDAVIAFGCKFEALNVGLIPNLENPPCDKWCKRIDCPVYLKEMP